LKSSLKLLDQLTIRRNTCFVALSFQCWLWTLVNNAEVFWMKSNSLLMLSLKGKAIRITWWHITHQCDTLTDPLLTNKLLYRQESPWEESVIICLPVLGKMKTKILRRFTDKSHWWCMQSLPIYWVWYYWLSPTAWTLYGLVTSQLGDVTSPITVKGTYGTHVQATNETRLPMREFLDTHFGFHHSFLPYVAIWHVGIVLVFGLVFAISIKRINFQRR
jgi:hypothetical protein